MLKRVLIKSSKYFFLVLFLGFSVSITLFNHSHVIDGYTLAHSHPFKNSESDVPYHKHSVNGFLLIHFLADLIALVSVLVLFHEPLLVLLRKFGQGSYPGFFNPDYLNPNSLRGPPQIMFSFQY